ncbi:hypothetical protein [Nocardia nepalensis]
MEQTSGSVEQNVEQAHVSACRFVSLSVGYPTRRITLACMDL